MRVEGKGEGAGMEGGAGRGGREEDEQREVRNEG